MNNIEKLSMEYYIEKRKWEQTFEFLKGVKGIHSKNEKRLRIFMEAVGIWFGVAVSGVFCQKFTSITGVYIGGLKGGVKRKFWQKYMQQNPDLEVAVIDGTIVRAHACSA